MVLEVLSPHFSTSLTCLRCLDQASDSASSRLARLQRSETARSSAVVPGSCECELQVNPWFVFPQGRGSRGAQRSQARTVGVEEGLKNDGDICRPPRQRRVEEAVILEVPWVLSAFAG